MLELFAWALGHVGDVLSKTELWAALIGAWFGGWLSSKAADRQMVQERDLTRQQMRHERELTRENARWGVGVSVVREMLDPLETMGECLEWLRSRDRSGGRNSDTLLQRARTAYDRMDRLNRTHAPLLPAELADRWYTIVYLADQYRRASTQEPGSRWTAQMISRAYDDIRNYMRYVSTSLSVYVGDGTITPYCPPPNLRRDEGEMSWTPS